MAESTIITVKHIGTEVTIKADWDADIHTITSLLVGALVSIGFPYQVIMMGMQELVGAESNEEGSITTTYSSLNG